MGSTSVVRLDSSDLSRCWSMRRSFIVCSFSEKRNGRNCDRDAI